MIPPHLLSIRAWGRQWWSYFNEKYYTDVFIKEKHNLNQNITT